MFKQKIFIAFFLVFSIVAFLNFVGVQDHFYVMYKWYDIPMHILGGLSVSLFFLSYYGYFHKDISIPDYNKKIFCRLLLVLLCVTISWEIFELAIHSTFLSEGAKYWFDTIKDIIDGFIGGMIGYFFFIKNKTSRS